MYRKWSWLLVWWLWAAVEGSNVMTPHHLQKAESNNTEENYIVYDLQIILEAVKVLNHSTCGRDALIVMEAMTRRERWALQMFDSSSKFPVGLLYGNFYQMGNFDECINLKQPSADPPIQGQYCLADVQLNNPSTERIKRSSKEKSRHSFNNTIFWSICVPSSCTVQDVQAMVKEIFVLATVGKTVDVRVEPHKCHLKTFQPVTSLEIIYGSVIGAFVVLTIMATGFHYYVLQEKQSEKSSIKEAVLCFSLIRTVGKFLATTSSELNLNCICGIKFLSMFFIITGHTFLFLIAGPVKNTSFYQQESTNVLNAIFINSPLLVDTFLLVSGFLLSYILLLELDKRKGGVNVLVLYIARYIRLTPSYLVVIGLYCTCLVRMGDGPLWDSRIREEQQRCKNSWWTNLLYINNYVDTDSMCMFQSWYLAVDYHLFIVSSLIIVVLWKRNKLGQAILILSLVASIAAPFVITFQDHLDPTLMAFAPELYDISLNHYFKTAYIRTHMRAGSYILGVVLGYTLYRLQTRGAKIPTMVLWLGWLFSAACGVTSMFSVVVFYYPDHSYNPTEAAIYASLHRVAWCVAISWIIVVCVTRNARIVDRFLSWKVFVPLSRLTYCAYLINGFVEVYSFASLREGVYMSKFELANKSLSHTILTFSLGFVLCIFFESPIHGLEKVILKKDAARHHKPDTGGDNHTTKL